MQLSEHVIRVCNGMIARIAPTCDPLWTVYLKRHKGQSIYAERFRIYLPTIKTLPVTTTKGSYPNQFLGDRYRDFPDILPTVRPVPYHSTGLLLGEAELARGLRGDFVPLLRRRLPCHHLCGLPHGAVPRFVDRYRKAYPFFLRTDIAKFYPSVRHQDLVVGVQIAWRDLLGLSYVPSKFKKRYLGPLLRWCERLPLHRGIPLGSPVSAVAAPLMLVPLWLEVRRTFGVPLTVYMDDVLVCCRDAQQCAEVYARIENRLHNDFDLAPHVGKTESGRFATGRFSFCGWSFAGGYARIDEEKERDFAERITRSTCARGGERNSRALVKRVNRLVDGFGHYYKHGDVKRQYERLDVLIRRSVREALSGGSSRRIYNGELERLGLRSLCGILERDSAKTKAGKATAVRNRPLRKPVPSLSAQAAALRASCRVEGDSFREETLVLLRSLDAKLSQLVKEQRTLCRTLERLGGMW